MNARNRREILADVGRGMLIASLGSATVLDLELAPALAEQPDGRLTFGKSEPLVSLMQETPPDRLLPMLVGKLRGGVDLKTLVSAAALANARAFGGQDYTGYHTFMALMPAFQMAAELPAERRPLPVLKVLYRNSSRIQQQGSQDKDVLDRLQAPAQVTSDFSGEQLRDAVRAVDWDGAETGFAAIATESLNEAYNRLQFAVQDEADVHRVVLAWRAWSMVGLTGEEHAHAMLRQSVRFCLQAEQRMRDRNRSPSPLRQLLPRLLDEYGLLGKPLGSREMDDAWVEELARMIFSGTREQAAEAVAAELSEGAHPEAVGEAISVAANLLVLHDPGRRERNSTPEKPAGCVHGDSVGVHASDAANAWRNTARVGNARNRAASLIVGAFHTAGQQHRITVDPYPYEHLLEEIGEATPATLLEMTDEAIRANDQARACALVHRCGGLQTASRDVFDLLLKYAVSEDGALHAEKYYRTVVEEFAATRPAFRWRQLVALARVTASEYGFPAPGVEEAADLLSVS